jgi:hypothetical protein
MDRDALQIGEDRKAYRLHRHVRHELEDSALSSCTASSAERDRGSIRAIALGEYAHERVGRRGSRRRRALEIAR